MRIPRLCSPKPNLDHDIIPLELFLHVGAAIVLGLAIDIPWTIFRKRVIQRAIDEGTWANRNTRRALLYLAVFFAHLFTLMIVLWMLSFVIPCLLQEWQFSLEGMFFPAIFFTLQTNLFTCLTGGFYELL